MVGGRIDPGEIITKNIGTPVVLQDVVEGQKKREVRDYDRFLRETAQSAFGGARLIQELDPLVDFRPRNVIAHSSYQNFFTRYPEKDLIKGVEKLYSGRGSHADHPKLHQLFSDSLGHHPELMSLYANSEVEDEKNEVEDEKRDDVIDAYQKAMHEKKYGPASYERAPAPERRRAPNWVAAEIKRRKKHKPGSLEHLPAAPTMRWLKWKYPEWVDDVKKYQKRKDKLSKDDLADLKWMKNKYPEKYDMVMRFISSRA